MIDVPRSALWICRTLEEAGFECWAVGGAVRDALLDPDGAGASRSDWDLATRATPREVRRIFRRTVPLGIDHGTVGVLDAEGRMYEVTTFRQDVSTDGRRAVVAYSDTIEEDLARRDFTINALAWHPIREELLDPYRGRDDLAAGVLRTVGDPHERYHEDYLRVLRGLRFAGQFGLTIEERSWQALVEALDGLSQLSAERIREELIKVLGRSARPSITLELYAGSGALERLYPELERMRRTDASEDDSAGWRRSVAMVDALPRTRPTLRLAALLHELENPASDVRAAGAVAAILLRYKFSNADTDRVTRLSQQIWGGPSGDEDDAGLRRWIARIGRDLVHDVARLRIARFRSGADTAHTESSLAGRIRAMRAVARGGLPLSVQELELDGKDLIRMGFRPGPGFRRTLESLLDEVLERPERNRAETLETRVVEGWRAGEFPLEERSPGSGPAEP